MILKTFSEAVSYILTYIPKTSDTTFPGVLGWERTKNIMDRLGNPQNSLKIIHVAGTSGKGSTCTLISRILQSQGMTVGLNLSPHIVDIRERVQIQNQLIDKDDFVMYLNQILPVIEDTRNTKYGKPTYFDVITALAFTAFADKQVDYAVIETGLGGLLDGTNVVTREDKIAVITKIGLDHMAVLGNTEVEIAAQKAGIIQPGNPVFTLLQKPEILNVFEHKAHDARTHIEVVPIPEAVENISEGIQFSFQGTYWNLPNLVVGLHGAFQAENTALALRVCEFVAQRDGIPFNNTSLREFLGSAHFPGRFEEVSFAGKNIILDGAHNPQKMQAFIAGLQHRYPGKKFHVILACKQGKNIAEIVPLLLPIASHFILTTFTNKGNDLIHTSTKPEEIAAILERNGFHSYQVIQDLKEVISQVKSDSHEYIITGSLYLIGEVAPLIEPDN